MGDWISIEVCSAALIKQNIPTMKQILQKEQMHFWYHSFEINIGDEIRSNIVRANVLFLINILQNIVILKDSLIKFVLISWKHTTIIISRLTSSIFFFFFLCSFLYFLFSFLLYHSEGLHCIPVHIWFGAQKCIILTGLVH